jgi:hypothetical protein
MAYSGKSFLKVFIARDKDGKPITKSNPIGPRINPAQVASSPVQKALTNAMKNNNLT